MRKVSRLLAWSLGLLLTLAACRPGAVARLTPTPGPTAAPADRPTSAPTPPGLGGRWIEVDLTEHVVRLHETDRVVATYLAATGEGSRPEYVTYTGLFEVQQKYKGPEESAPGVYVTDILVFDLPHGNGFHSFPWIRRARSWMAG